MRKLPLLLLAGCCATTGFAQTKLGNNVATLNANAVLEMETTNQGVLLPRVTLTGTTAATPLSGFTAGMVVYNTATAGTTPNNVVPGLYISDGTKWVRLLPENATLTGAFWGASGNSGTATTNFLGTTDSKDLVFKTNNAERLRLTKAGGLYGGNSTNYMPDTASFGIAWGHKNLATRNYSSAIGYSDTVTGIGNGAWAIGYLSNATGDRAIAIGTSNTASATYSNAFGYRSFASGTNAGAWGNTDTASGTGNGAWAIGQLNNATGDRAIAIGSSNTASATYSTAFGYRSSASGINAGAWGNTDTAIGTGTGAWAIGTGNKAIGTNAVAVGTNAVATSNYSTAMGNAPAANGIYSVALGNNTAANSYNMTAAGVYNAIDSTASSTATLAKDPLFTIGNGTSTVRGNALNVVKSGQVVINTSTSGVVGYVAPRADLDVRGSGGVIWSVGTTANRPVTPVAGMVRFNTDSRKFEGYDGVAWYNMN